MSKSKNKNKIRSLVKAFLLFLNLIVTVSLLISYAAPYISPEKYWIFAFFGLGYPIILILNILFVLLWLVLWKKYIWIPVIALLIGINHLLAIIQWNSSEKGPETGNSIKLMTFNVHSLYGISAKNSDRGVRSRVSDFLREENPDILCIQEFFVKSEDSTKVLERFAHEINGKYFFFKNYYEIKDKRKINALATFTKYPIASVGHFRLKNKNVFAIFTDIVIDSDTIRFFNLHLESIRFGNEDYSFYSHLTEAETKTFTIKEGSLKIFSKLKKAFEFRAKQVDIIQRSIAESPYPVIVCGDFNDTPSSYSYRILTKNLRDAFRRAGKGIFGSTYAGNFPSFRIDYILIDKRFDVSNYVKSKTDLSDHYPVSVDLITRP